MIRFIWSHLFIILIIIIAVVVLKLTPSTVKPIEQTKKIGNEIKGALEEYAQKHSKYPKNLNELVPEFLPEINNPRWGMKKWSYSIQSEDYWIPCDNWSSSSSVRASEKDAST